MIRHVMAHVPGGDHEDDVLGDGFAHDNTVLDPSTLRSDAGRRLPPQAMAPASAGTTAQ
jgi:hypothetical protein